MTKQAHENVIPVLGETYFEPRHPKPLAKGILGFSLTVVKAETREVLLESKGWRVLRGDVHPPSMQDRKGKWFSTTYPSEALLKQLGEVVKELWEGDYPDVEFPRCR